MTRFAVKGAVTLLWAAFIFPLLWMVLSSVKSPAEITELPVTLWPKAGWHLGNYLEAWTRGRMARTLMNSAIVSSAVVLCQLVTSTAGGYLLARGSRRYTGPLLWLCFFSLLVPYQLTLVPAYIVLARLRLIDTYAALIVPFASGALGVLIMRRQFLALPPELEDSARVDGCSLPAMLWHVLAPAVGDGLKAVAGLSFLFSWNNLLWPLIMTHRDEVRTVAAGLAFLSDELSGEWHVLMAGAVMATVPALAVLWWLRGSLPYVAHQEVSRDERID